MASVSGGLQPDGISVALVWVAADWPVSPLPASTSQASQAQPAYGLPGVNAPAILRRQLRARPAETVNAFLQRILAPAALLEINSGEKGVSVFGRRVRAAQQLAEGDRIELLGPISADPKSDRHKRVSAQRASAERSIWKRSNSSRNPKD